MQTSRQNIAKGITVAFFAVLLTVALIVAGCSAMSTVATTVISTTTAVPISLTDAPDDQVVAASLTLNSIVLSDASGKTASILSAPLTFEATHLDAVQEPLFTRAIPEDMVGTTGLEPATSSVSRKRSNQLSYAPVGQ